MNPSLSMDTLKKSFDDSLRRIRGKMKLVGRPHVSVKEWIESNISINSIISSKTGSNYSSSSSTSGPSTCSYKYSPEVVPLNEMPSKPSKFMVMNMQLQDIFEEDNSIRMKEVLEKGLDPNFIDLNGKPLVYRAVEENKYNILDTMLEFGFGCDVNSTCHNEMNGGWTALHLACHLGDLKAVEILLGVDNSSDRLDNCDVNAVDIDGRTPLHVLAASSAWHCPYDVKPIPAKPVALNKEFSFIGNYYPIPKFAENTDDDSDQKNLDNDQASNMRSSKSKNHNNEKALENCSLSDINDNTAHATGYTNKFKLANGIFHSKSLANSSANNSLSSSQNSIDGSPNFSNVSTKYSRTLVTDCQKICHQSCPVKPLNDYSTYSHHMVVKKTSGTNKKRKEDLKLTVHGKIMKILLRAGVNANRVDEYDGTPMHICALRGNVEGVKILLEHGADYDLVDSMCETALVKAIVHQRADVVKCLLKAQHSMSEMKRYELSELVFTIIEDLRGEKDEKDGVEIIKALIKKRIHINVTDSRNRTPLHVAILYGCESVASMLIKQPTCEIDCSDEDGFTPLYLAAWNPKKNERQSSQLALLQKLINGGADINHCDVCKVLPVNAALESGQFISAFMLIQQGSVVNSNKWFCAAVDKLRFNSSTLPFVERFVLSMSNNYRHTPQLIEVATILGQMNLVTAIIKAGANTASINFIVLQRWVSNETRTFVVNDLEKYLACLQEMIVGKTLTLKDLCRISIRKALACNVWAKAGKLPLPDMLQDFIMLKDIDLERVLQ